MNPTPQGLFIRKVTGNIDEVWVALDKIQRQQIQVASSGASFYAASTDILTLTTVFQDVPGCFVNINLPGKFDVTAFVNMALAHTDGATQFRIVVDVDPIVLPNTSPFFLGYPIVANRSLVSDIVLQESFGWIVDITNSQVQSAGSVVIKLQANKIGGAALSQITQPTALKVIRLGGAGV